MVCTWQSGGLFCKFPCALFEGQATSGFCIFHRRTPDGVDAARLAEQSHHTGSAEYVERAKDLMYGPRGEDGRRADNTNVAELRSRLRIRKPAGVFGELARKAGLDIEPLEQEEPGANG